MALKCNPPEICSAFVERPRKHPCGILNDGDHPPVHHPGGSDHPDGTQNVLSPPVGRGNDSDTFGAFQARFIFYATVQALASGLFMLITWEVRRSGLHRENIPSDLFSRAMRQGVVLALAFLLSIPVSFFSEWAYACWAFVPLINLVITRVRARRRTT